MPEFSTWMLSPSSPEQTIGHVRDAPLEFEPGSEYSYNNSGYILLGHLIERLSGQSYADFLKDRIFTPLAMNDSGVDSNTAMIENRAAGYTNSVKVANLQIDFTKNQAGRVTGFVMQENGKDTRAPRRD